MVRIAIVDDEMTARENIKKCLPYVSEREKIELSVTEFDSGRSFIGNYTPMFDIVLLDIEMPGEDGLETARMLRTMDQFVIIIFVTNMTQYALCGYEVDALDYIVKPLNPYDFAIKMHRAITRSTRRGEESVMIKKEGEFQVVPISFIKYLDRDGHYVTYHTVTGNYSEYTTLKDAEQKINKPFFVKCNRSFLVNLKFVDSIKNDIVIVQGEKLLISRPQKKAFLSAFAHFLGGGRSV